MRGAWLVALALAACARSEMQLEPVRQFPLDDLQGILTQTGVEIDAATSSDGKGSLRVTTREPTTVRLYEVEGLDVEDTQLLYRARLRTENVQGQVYLEMWCRFPGAGEFFSRALHQPLSGTTEWVSQETPFLLGPGQKPDLVKLNLVVEGSGTVWIDDVLLARGVS